MILALFLVPVVHAESDDSFAAPLPPAAFILGAASATIERPTTAPNLAATLANQFSTSTLPTDFALELTPWWLVPHDFTITDYLSGGPRALWEDLALSVATTSQEITVETADSSSEIKAEGEDFGIMDFPVATTADDTVTESTLQLYEVALGLRSSLVRGGHQALVRDATTCIARLRATEVSASEWIAHWLLRPENSDKSPGQASDAWNREESDLAAKADSIHQECTDILQTRRGFALDLAGGAALAIPNLNASDAALNRYGAWLAPALLGKRSSITGMAGIFGENLSISDPSTFAQGGIQYTWEWKAVAVSPEAIYRYRLGSGTPHEGQTDLTIEARLAENLWVSTSLGLGFPIDSSGSFISLFRLNYDSGVDRGLHAAMAPTEPLPVE